MQIKGNLHALRKKKPLAFFPLYYLSGRIQCFFRKSVLNISGFYNSDDSTKYADAYQLIELVITHGS